MLVGTLALVFCAPADVNACTATAGQPISLGSVDSFTLQTTSQTGLTNTMGLTCPPPLLTLLTSGSITATMNSDGLLEMGAGNAIPYQLFADPGHSVPIVLGQPVNYMSEGLVDLLGLFGTGWSGTIPLYARTTPSPGLNVAAGVYSDTVTIAWAWNYCLTGIGSLCLDRHGPGTGSTVVNVTIEVLPACNITAPDINFGQAPMAGLFDGVTQEVAVTCTKDLDPFFVSMSNGGAPGGGRRAMTNGGNRLEYDLFKGATTEVWGPSGSARVANPAPANGSSAQLFPYTARIYADQDTPPPGTYSDNLTVEVVIDP